MNWYKKHQNFEKFASKEILYHGTSLKNLQSIMSQGLIPDPKKRAWSDDTDTSVTLFSRKSFEGIYLTRNIRTARSSATQLSGRKQVGGLILAVQAEKKTLVLDEDNIVGKFTESIKDFYLNSYWHSTENYVQYKLGNMEEKFDISANSFLEKVLEKVQEPRKTNIINATKSLIVDVLKSLLERSVSYLINERKGYENEQFKHILEINGLNINDIPNKNIAEDLFRDFLDRAIKKLKIIAEISDENSWNINLRSLTPIRFVGSNKIICIISFEQDPDKKNGEEMLKIYYKSDQSVFDNMIKDWKNTGNSYSKIVDLTSDSNY